MTKRYFKFIGDLRYGKYDGDLRRLIRNKNYDAVKTDKYIVNCELQLQGLRPLWGSFIQMTKRGEVNVSRVRKD